MTLPMFCPLCQSEYREGFTRCNDCDVPLVVELPEHPAEAVGSDASDEDAPVLLWRGGDPVEYTALIAALCDAGISFEEGFPRDFENTVSSRSADRLYYGVPNFDLRVHHRDLFAGLRVVESVQKQLLRTVEPEAIGVDTCPTAGAACIAEPAITEHGDRTPANVKVWSGDDESKAEFLMDTLIENQIPARIVTGSDADWSVMILVHASDESRAREILREITDGRPPS